MNKILTKSEQIPRPRPFLYMRGFRAASSEEKGQFFVQNRMNPKRDKNLYIIGNFSDLKKLNKNMFIIGIASTGFRKSTQKSTKTEKSQKGVYLGSEIFKGKKY